MGIWREPRRLNFSFPRGKFMSIVYPGATNDAPCRIEYRQYIGDKPVGPIGWRANEDNTIVVRVTDAESASTLAEGKDLAQRVTAQLAGGEIVPESTERYQPEKSTVIEVIEHPSGKAKATVSKWAENKFEIFVAVWAPDGMLMPVQTPSISTSPDFSWCRMFDERIYSNDLQDAKEAGRASLEAAAQLAEKLANETESRKQEVSESE